MNIAILEPKIKSKLWRMISTIVLFIATSVLPSIFLEPILDKRIFMLVVLLLTILLLVIISKIINAYKIIGTVELNDDYWVINKQDFKKEILIQDIKKINLKLSLGMSKVWNGNTSYITNIILKNNESYSLEISREEIKNGKLLSTHAFNNSRFDLFTYLEKRRIKYDW